MLRTGLSEKPIGVIRSTVVVGTDGKVETAQYNVKAAGDSASAPAMRFGGQHRREPALARD